MTFEIGQIFENKYPPEAAQWCNDNGKTYIEEIEPLNDVRRFQIRAIPEPTEEEKNKQTQAHLTSTVQNLLDTEAKKIGYDSCLSVCSTLIQVYRSLTIRVRHFVLGVRQFGQRDTKSSTKFLQESEKTPPRKNCFTNCRS